MKYTTQKTINGYLGTIETEKYKWFWGQPDYVQIKSTDEIIYQGYVNQTRLGEQEMEEYINFLSLKDRVEKEFEELKLESLKKDRLAEDTKESKFLCKKCGSFCWGDCET